MAENITDRTITILAEDADLKRKVRAEGALRGHNISEAGLRCLELGLPLYLEQIQPIYPTATAKSSRKRKAA